MPSIIELIEKAEVEAEQIRKQGAQDARDIVSNANSRVKADCDAARMGTLADFERRKEVYRLQAAKLHGEIVSERRAVTDSECNGAAARLELAVKYIIERAANV